MTSEELLNRLKQFAYRVVKVTKILPANTESDIIRRQVLRASFSAAANYRSACKAYSKKAFSSKLGISFEEIDEAVFWLEVIADLDLIKKTKLTLLIKEGEELCKILAKSIITSKAVNKI
ncbi:MAG: four helix bundle protein [Chitinophagales bacterium]